MFSMFEHYGLGEIKLIDFSFKNTQKKQNL